MVFKRQVYNIIDKCSFKINGFFKFFMETEKWPYEQFLDYQLKKVIDICKVWDRRVDSWDDFYSLPVTTKEDLPVQPRNTERGFHTHETSGSTGEPRIIYVPKETWYRKDAVFLRSWHRMGRDFEPVLRLMAGEPKYAWYDRWRNVEPMNYRKITDEHVNFLVSKKPYLMHGPGGAIRQLCERLIQGGHGDILKQIKIEWCSESAEGHKERLEKFVKEFHQQYGLAELPTVGSPDGYGNMRVVMETGIVEILDDNGVPCKYEQEGNIVVTDYNNYLMPVIRYKTGDRAKIKFFKSPNGDEYPIIYDVKGRGVDYYFGPEVKRPIGWWVVSPISHHYGDIISKWRIDVFPKRKELILHVVFTNGAENYEGLKPYQEWIKAETGLRTEIVSHKKAEDWKRKLVKVSTE